MDDVKDNTVPGDRFAIQDSVDAGSLEDDGRRVVRGAAAGQWKAFLTRFMIVAWSFPVPIPAVAGDGCWTTTRTRKTMTTLSRTRCRSGLTG